MSNIQQPIGQQLSNGSLVNNIKDGLSNTTAAVTNTLSNVRDTVSNSVQGFSSKNLVESGNDFIQSNTIIAKFVFLILVLIIFLLLLHLGIYILNWVFQPAIADPYVVAGYIAGNQSLVVPQDPKKDRAVTIYRSNNQSSGMEFTWCAWLNILNVAGDKKLHVFSKGGNGTFDANGVMTVDNAPGMYLSNSSENGAKITIMMNTVALPGQGPDATIYESVEIDNLPLKKWFHVAIRLQNKILDVYINGTIAKRVSFSNVPKQNYGDVYVSGNGGYNGGLSDLRYFARALNVFEINNIVMKGPNLTPTNAVLAPNDSKKYDYLSSAWNSY
jgi:hypothetical protein